MLCLLKDMSLKTAASKFLFPNGRARINVCSCSLCVRYSTAASVPAPPLQSLAMQVREEVVGVREERLVPGVAAPAKVVTGLIHFVTGEELRFADVPTHVDHEHIERHIVLVKAFHELIKFLVR